MKRQVAVEVPAPVSKHARNAGRAAWRTTSNRLIAQRFAGLDRLMAYQRGAENTGDRRRGDGKMRVGRATVPTQAMEATTQAMEANPSVGRQLVDPTGFSTEATEAIIYFKRFVLIRKRAARANVARIEQTKKLPWERGFRGKR